MGITWEEAEVAAQNRSEWRQSVAQCGFRLMRVESRATRSPWGTDVGTDGQDP